MVAGTLMSVLIAVAFVASTWWYFEVGVRGGPFIGIVAGALDCWWPSGVRWFAGCEPHGAGLRDALYAATRVNGFTLPLVYPFAAVAVPTLFVWRRGRKRVKPGHCRSCGYDLTGNVSGRCPECGVAT